MENKDKKIYIEWLRMLAVLFVIYNHTRTRGYDLYQVTDEVSSRWLSIAMIPLCKTAVPIFMMIAGANLLAKNESLQEVMHKRVLRYVVVIVAFGTLQFLRYVRSGKVLLNLANWVKAIYSEPVIEPYWFLYLYLGFLLLLPFLRKMAQGLDKREFIYLFCLMTIYKVLTAMGCFLGIIVNNNMFVMLSVNVFFYPLLGYGIDKYSVRRDCRKYGILYVLSFLAGFGCGVVYVQRNPEHIRDLAEVMQIFTPMLACAIFGLAKTVCKQKENAASKLLIAIGSTTFGIYLTEDIIRNQVEKLLMWVQNGQYMNDFVLAVLYVVLTFLIGVCVIHIAKKMPVLRKLI